MMPLSLNHNGSIDQAPRLIHLADAGLENSHTHTGTSLLEYSKQTHTQHSTGCKKEARPYRGWTGEDRQDVMFMGKKTT